MGVGKREREAAGPRWARRKRLAAALFGVGAILLGVLLISGGIFGGGLPVSGKRALLLAAENTPTAQPSREKSPKTEEKSAQTEQRSPKTEAKSPKTENREAKSAPAAPKAEKPPGEQRRLSWQELEKMLQKLPPPEVVLCTMGHFGNRMLTERYPLPPPRITISPKTTYLTEPLRPDGLPDYRAAIDRRLAEGVSPENNAAVLVWKAWGPKEIPPEIRQEFFRRLGMEPLPEEGDYFCDFWEYAQKVQNRLGEKELSEEKIWQMFEQAWERPWRADQLPLVAEWLQSVEKPLNLLVEASRRTRWYEPVLVKKGPQGEEELVEIQTVWRVRDMVSRSLRLRAFSRLGEGKLAEAWEDLLAIHRLARLLTQGGEIYHDFVGRNLEPIACQVDQLLAAEGNLSAQQALAFRDALLALPPFPPMAERIHQYGRFGELEAVCKLARQKYLAVNIFGLYERGTFGPWARPAVYVLSTPMRWLVDWDYVLERVNQSMDRLVEAGRKPWGRQRLDAIDAVEREVELLDASLRTTSWMQEVLKAPRQKASELVAGALVVELNSFGHTIYRAEGRVEMYRRLAPVGFALAAYRADHGKYPDQLADLPPKYLPQIPQDIYADNQPVRYRHTDAEVIVYSLGWNGEDEQGYNVWDDPDRREGRFGDDIAVRLKQPGSSPTPSVEKSNDKNASGR